LHRIRHYGLLANGSRKSNLAAARQFLAVTVDVTPATTEQSQPTTSPLRRHRSSCVVTAAAAWRSLLLLAPERSIRAPPRTAARWSNYISSVMRCHRQPRRRASRHANPISDKQMVGGSRSVTIDVAALPHVRAGVRQPLTSSTVDGATTNGGHAIHCGPALARTTALRRTAALGRQQLAGTGRPSAAVRSPRSPVPKLPLSSAKRSAALPLCRRRL